MMTDPATLRVVAEIARRRAGNEVDPKLRQYQEGRDGLVKLGAQKALLQLAVDLEALAGAEETARRGGGERE